MNLLVKRFISKYILKPGLIILIPVFFGCETQNDLGIGYNLNSDANVRLMEFDLPASNVYIDSLRTDGENRILVGKYSDPLTGNTAAEGYFQFFYEQGPLPRAKSTDDLPSIDTLKIDSIVLLLEASSIIPQRGTSFQEFTLFDLQDTLDSRAIYLSSFKQTVGNEIGTYSKAINVATDTLFRIKFSDTYAKSLYGQISQVSGDPDQSIIAAEFKSLGIIPGDASQSVCSFNLNSDTTRIILYSSPNRVTAKDTTYITYLRSSGKNYTYIDRDRSTSSLSGIEENENFDLPSGKTIIEPLTGISTSFSIDPLVDFFAENRSILVNNATLTFDFESENNRDTLTNFLQFIRKEDNSIFGPAVIANSFGNLVMSDDGYLRLSTDPVNGSLNSSKEKILMSPTLFFQQVYRPFSEDNLVDSLTFLNPTNGDVRSIDEFVLVSPFNTTLQRTIFEPNGVKLKLYYTEVDQ